MSDNKPKLLAIADDPLLREQLSACFDNYEILFAACRSEALAELRRHEPPIVMQDFDSSPEDPRAADEQLATLQEILALAPHTKVIVIIGDNNRDTAQRAVAEGAYGFFHKPFDVEVLSLIVNRAVRMYELEEENRLLLSRQDVSPLAGIIAVSEIMRRVCRTIEKVAPTQASTLLLGESGTGKELLARALHRLSGRAQQPFVAINCAAIPETLLESELFGYEKGAFTGAVKQTPGKLESANGGTLFLDEIGDMPPSLQAKLLRFLQERVIERVGGRETIPIDLRIISATHRNLESGIAAGEFRQDLYYRISEVSVQIPPLRERKSDVLVIAQNLLEDRARRHGRALRFAPDAIRALQEHGWPGNIRELENRINGAAILAEGKQVTAADLGLTDSGRDPEFLNLRTARQRAEQSAVRSALAVTGGNMTRAAELLGLSRPTLYDLMEKYGMQIPR
jgi:two-component system NtrC family response regulator